MSDKMQQLAQLKRPPTSSRWSLVHAGTGWRIWRAASGRLFYERLSDRTWWRGGMQRRGETT